MDLKVIKFNLEHDILPSKAEAIFIIAEGERLKAENEELHKDGMTIYAMMGDKRARAASQRCLDIVMKAFVEGKTLPVAADIIKEEFKL